MKQAGQQPNLDQVAFEEQMAKMTPEEWQAAVKGLTALARSKALNEPLPGELRDASELH